MKFITQAAKVLNEQKKYKRRLAVFLCLAVVVALGTAAALKMYGQAMSHKQKKLVCQYAAHVHTDECFDGEAVVCGYADYAVHLHNDDCYGPNGELVCHLPEAEAHVHTEECYTEQEVLICEEEGAQAHEHTEGCYTPERGDLSCQMEEHMHEDSCYGENGEIICPMEEHQHDDNCYEWKDVLTCTLGGHEHTQDCYTREMRDLSCNLEEHGHGEACYDENGELACQLEEHTHDDNCYVWEDVLTCQLEESDGGHVHGDGCYEMQKVLSCGKLELHTHDDSCCDENGALVCGLLQLEEHVHGEDCFETVELTEEEIIALSSANSISEDELRGISENELEVHTHDDSCYDAAGGLMCGYDEEPPITQTYTDEDKRYTITAAYHKDANIPENAELRAQMITTESDREYFSEREAEVRETLKDENVQMDALFKIGFFVDDEEIEPDSDVTVTVQFLDRDGLADGTPMTIVHFGEDGNEVLGGSHVKDKSTTFKTKEFSDFAAIFHKVLMAAKTKPVPSEPNAAAEDKDDGEGAETSSGNTVSSGSVSGYKGDSYAFLIGHQEDGTEQQTKDMEKEMTQPQSVIISGNYAYQGNGYDITFHVEGKAMTTASVSADSIEKTLSADNTASSADENGSPTEEEENGSGEPEENAGTSVDDSTQSAEDTGEDSAGETTQTDNDDGYLEEDGDTPESEESVDTPGTDSEGTKDSEILIDDVLNEKLKFKIEDLGNDSDEHRVIQEYLKKQKDTGEQIVFDILSYSMIYDGMELNLTDCTVKAVLHPEVDTLKTYAEEALKDNHTSSNAEITVDAMEITESSEVKDLDRIVISDSAKTMEFSLKSGRMSIQANADANPKFTVQYYAWLDEVIMENGGKTDAEKNKLNVIDTESAKDGEGKSLQNPKLPQNGASAKANMPLKKITVSENGTLKTKQSLTEVYSQRECTYTEAPNLAYFDKLYSNGNYTLKQVWILKSGKSADSTNPSDWEVKNHTYQNPGVHFTNKPDQIGKDIVCITPGTVIRLVYETTKDMRTNDSVRFYDYDITDDGKTTANKKGPDNSPQQDGDVRLRGNGINTSTNYSDTNVALYAFGNANSGTGLWTQKFNDPAGSANELNKTNDNSYAGCTFGLADSLTNEGKIRYRNDIRVPNLFNDGSANGKREMLDKDGNPLYKLDFARNGDGYILSNVVGSNTANNLNQFSHPDIYDGVQHKKTIWTNNFWPLDGNSGKDGKSGQKGNAKKFTGYSRPQGFTNPYEYGENRDYPPSDDGVAHNNMFGMHFTVDFKLTKDYIGPLNYLFFGDDDMWVFLSKVDENDQLNGEGRLICDIGGVHSSVGEYVNLWDYIEQGGNEADGKYRLSFFYTERGLSGSSCYMQFTLPSVSIKKPDQTTGNLKVMKKAVKVNGGNEEGFVDGDVDKDRTYKFKIALATTSEGLYDDYSYRICASDGTTRPEDIHVIRAGQDFSNESTFELKHGQYIVVDYLPVGMEYRIIECDPDLNNYVTDINGNPVGNREIRGTISDADKGKTVEVEYKNKLNIYSLPETGGFGTVLYTIAGVLIILLGAGSMYRGKIRKGGI